MAHVWELPGSGKWFGVIVLMGLCWTGRGWAAPPPVPPEKTRGPGEAASRKGAADPFAPGEAFAGCGVRKRGELGYDCGNLAINLADMNGNTPEVSIGTLEQISRERGGARMRLKRFQRELGGRQWPALRTECLDSAQGFCEVSETVAFSRPDGAIWQVACFARGKQPEKELPRCLRIQEYLASQEPPGGLVVTPFGWKVEGPPQLFSRQLAVPEGCQVKRSEREGGRIECPGSALFWNILPMDSMFRRAALGMAGQLRQSVAASVRQLEERKASCQVEGAPGQCLIMEGEGAQGRIRTIVGVASLQGKGLVIACFLSQGEQDPPVCNGVFQWK